ncbi:MAG: Flp pilus assembly complex ATPase component TadA [Verrucomicrobia bacterium]|nr:Flp pilus assembly complex ATPase component TadA [Verrucomicrobiota bacterium]
MAFVIINGGGFRDDHVEIKGGRLTFGRSLDCDVILRDEDVSSRHAQIIRNQNVYWLQDLGSTNGTWIKDSKVLQQALETGDQMVIGKYKITFSDSEGFVQTRDAATVEDIRRSLHDQLISELNLKRLSMSEMADASLRKKTSDVLDRLLHAKRRDIPREFDLKEIKKAVLDAALGLGPLEDLLSDPEVTEIMVNGPSKIYVERKGRLELSTKSFLSKQEILTAIERVVGPLGRRIDESSPMVDARLADGSRVNAIIPPLALDSPTVTIRKFPDRRFTAQDYLNYRSMTEGMVEFLRFCVLGACNVIISGGTGTGKTTLLNVMSSFIPGGDRIITIEDSAELQLPQEHVVRLETRPPNIEGKGEVAIRDLVRNALRMRPNRIVVGECRGGEALDMLQAMNTGHDGSMTTVHANSPPDALRRLENLVLMSGMDLPIKAIRELIFSAVDLIVQISRFPDGSRKITAISEVAEMYEGDILLNELFTFQRTGLTADGRTAGHHTATGIIPSFFEEMKEAGFGIDMAVFVPSEEEQPGA